MPQYGTIKAIRLPVDDKGAVKGFAFIEFEDTVGDHDVRSFGDEC